MMISMTPQEFKEIRKGLGLTQRALAHWIDPHAKNKDRDVRRWEAGDYTVPGSVEVIMLMFNEGDKPVHIRKAK